MDFPVLPKEHAVGEGCVKILTPDARGIAASYRRGNIPFPYWSQVWPAAIAVGQFLQDHPALILHKTVLELAAGLGLPSVVAALYAAHVLASDYAPEAVEIMQQTATLNGLQNMQVQLLDWNHLPEDLSADVLLLSDVSYDAALFAVQEKVIHSFLQKGTQVILGTPQRLIAKEAIAPLLPFCTFQEEIRVRHADAMVAITVMVLEGK